METKSPYFSPKKTRNFIKQRGLKAVVLQKSVQGAEENADHTGTERMANIKPVEMERKCNQRKKIQAEILSESELKTESIMHSSVSKEGSVNRMNPSLIPEIRIKSAVSESKRGRRKNIKVEVSTDNAGLVPHASFAGEKIPIKQELKSPKISPRKRTPIKAERSPEVEKQSKWEPANWQQMLTNIREMRQSASAPVDTMGCDQFKNDTDVPTKTRRFHTLVSLMLSSQTKDQVNYDCMQRLRKHGLTPENVVTTDIEVLEKLIYPVSFYKNKAKFIKQASQMLLTQHDGDIPNTIEDLLKLPGVGKKMAHLCMRSAWNVVTGIGVDTHVHRITNWLHWVPRETKTPEDTRVALEQWLPFELWEEVNQLLVGFGQTICTATYPRCNECLNADICPAKGKHGVRRTPIKKEIKREDLEF